jgi:hypothetical protein
MPDAARRTTMRDDLAVQRIGKSVRPSCERLTSFKDEQLPLPALRHRPVRPLQGLQ